MKTFKTILLLFILSATVVSCSSSNRMSGSKKGCGCGVHKGFVGY